MDYTYCIYEKSWAVGARPFRGGVGWTKHIHGLVLMNQCQILRVYV